MSRFKELNFKLLNLTTTRPEYAFQIHATIRRLCGIESCPKDFHSSKHLQANVSSAVALCERTLEQLSVAEAR